MHLRKISEHLGLRRARRSDLDALQAWLVEQAKAHARPTALLSWATEHLQRQRVLRPGVTILERMVVKARRQAEEEAYDRWTRFSRHLQHATERGAPRGRAHQQVLAAILAQACNIGFTRMADIASIARSSSTTGTKCCASQRRSAPGM